MGEWFGRETTKGGGEGRIEAFGGVETPPLWFNKEHVWS